jgi:hypothetical protein
MSSPYVGRSGAPGSAEFGATTVSGTAVGAPNGAQTDSIATGRAPGAVAGPQGPVAPAGPAGAAGAAARGGRPRGPRRAQLQLRHINPWTALKFSCVLGVALFFVWLIVIAILYLILDAAGAVGSINHAVTTIQGGNAKDPVTPGIVFGGALIIGVVNVVLFIALSTIGSVVYNLCADLVGGVELTLSER